VFLLAITYGQVQDAVLKLLDEFSSRGTALAATKTADYRFKIQQVTNDTIYQLASTTAKLPETFYVSYNPIKNSLVYDTSTIQQHTDTDISITLLNALSCYFECTGPATVVIEESLDGVTYTAIETITVASTVTALTAYRRLITPTSALYTVRLRFTGDYPYIFRNYVLYPYTFPTEDDVPSHGPWQTVTTPTDFLDLNYVEIEDGVDRSYYDHFIKTPEGDLAFYAYDGPMQLLVRYWRKPTLLTFTTDETANRALTIDLRDDAALLIPYNVAGEVLNSEEKGSGNKLLKEFAEKSLRLIQPMESKPASTITPKW
jgi:hypothetical protein